MSKKSILIAVLVLLLIGAGGITWYVLAHRASGGEGDKGSGSGKGGRGGGGSTQPITVVDSISKDIPVYLDGLGTVQAFQTVIVRPQIDGEVISVPFTEGQEVKVGDPIARLDTRIYDAQLEQANAHILQDTAKKAQDQGKLAQDNAKKLQDEAKQNQDRAKKSQDEENLKNAKLNLSRFEETLAAGATTEQAMTDQRSQVVQLESTIRGDAAAISGDQFQLDQDDATIQSDQAALKADDAAISADTAAMHYQETLRSYTVINAPIAGRTGIRQVDVGNIAHSSDPNGFVTITQLAPISVYFTLPQQDLDSINKRQTKGNLAVVAVEADGKTEIERGELMLVDNQIDTTTGTIKLKAKFDNNKRRLWPGGFVNIRLLLEVRENSVVVPAQSVQQGADTAYVYVIKDEKVEMRPVKVSMVQDNDAVIQTGLAAGEVVVLYGQDRLKQGMKAPEQRKVGQDGKPIKEAGEKAGQPDPADTPKTPNAEKSGDPDKKAHRKPKDGN